MTPRLAPSPTSCDVASGVRELHQVIDRLQELGTRVGRAAEAYDVELAEFERAIRRLESLKLGVVAAADTARAAARAGLADTPSWLARRTQSNVASAAQDVSLATALSPTESETGGSPLRPCAEALAVGDVSREHALVIVHATEQLPAGLSAAQIETVERDLVEKAGRLAPAQLRRVARRALEAVESDRTALDRHEDALLRSEQDVALAKTRLSLHDNGDGTTSGHFTVPTLAAAVLQRVIQSMTSPRRAALGATVAQAGHREERVDWARRSGQAFVELLEHLPTDHLHGKVAATIVVTIDSDRLLAALGAAGLDTGEALSAGDARRLACGAAGILPAVLDGASVPLDLGRSSRLFTEPQRVALATQHSTCAADGCERPYAWCELHHDTPWSQGGRTDLADAVPLCAFHHRRIHDRGYHHSRGPGGVTFSQRT